MFSPSAVTYSTPPPSSARRRSSGIYDEPLVNDPYDTKVRDGSVSLRGNLVDRSTTGGWRAATVFLLFISVDTLSTHGIAGNLVTYLTTTMQILNIDKISDIVNSFLGIAYILPVAWGYLADTILGRYYTILAACTVSSTGLLVLTLSASLRALRPDACVTPPCTQPTTAQLNWFYAGLFLISVGSAGLKPCVLSMGRDQYDDSHREERQRGQQFFKYFFVSATVTSVLAMTVFYYLEAQKGYELGWGFVASYFIFCTLAFLLATPFYRHRNPVGSMLTRVIQVLVVAFKNLAKPLPSSEKLYELDEKTYHQTKQIKLAHTERLRFLEKAAICPEVIPPVDPISGSWKLCTLTQVEELKTVVQILPIWACTFVVYTLYSQVTTVTVGVAMTLDRTIFKNFTIPAGTIGVFFNIGSMFFIPLYDRVIIPALRKFTKHPKGISDLRRIGFALALSIVALLISAYVESRRVQIISERFQPSDYESLSRGANYIPMTVFWLMPQYLLLGIVDFLVSVAQLDFFYSETPESMRSVATSLYYTNVSVGFFMSTALVKLVNAKTYKASSGGGWLNGVQLFQGGLVKFFYLTTVIIALNLALFIVAAAWYTHKVVEAADQPVASFQTASGTPPESSVDMTSFEDALNLK